MYRNFPKLLIILTLTVLNSCGGGGSSDSTSTNSYKLETIIDNLAFPIRIGELNSKKIVIAELNSGKLISYNLESKIATVIANFPPANNNAIGIAGMLVDKDFSSNKNIFVYHLDSNTNKNIVTRLTLE